MYISIIIRVLLIIITAIWFAFTVIGPLKVYTIIVVVAILTIQGYLLIRLLNNFNSKVYNYFKSLHDEGTSIKFKVPGDSNDELYNMINEVANMIHNARILKEQQYQYLSFIIETIPVAIIVVDNQEEVILSNNRTNQIFKIQTLQNLISFNNISPLLYNSVKDIKIGNQDVVQVKIGGSLTKLLVGLSEFKIENKAVHLYTFQDVKSELDENEIKAWQKLIRILNHELMNSITPITTLTHAIKKCITENGNIKEFNRIDRSTLNDILRNTELIEERSQGLIQFINNYRSLTSVKNLELVEFSIFDLFEDLKKFFEAEFEEKQITLITEINPVSLTLSADKSLVEHVMINLIKNAIESFEEIKNRSIKLASYAESSKIVVSITDSGKGIEESAIEDIFIPFFTTKKNGSGIGLSFSKQVMRMHNGEIKANSEPGKGSEFMLVFNYSYFNDSTGFFTDAK